jgi:hypothetical protein
MRCAAHGHDLPHEKHGGSLVTLRNERHESSEGPAIATATADIEAETTHISGDRREQPRRDAHQRGLPGTVRPYQG